MIARPVGNERRFALPPKAPILPGLRPPVPQPDWVARFGVALEVLRIERRDVATTTVRAIEARRLAIGLAARLSIEGMPMPDLDVVEDDDAMDFDRWAVHLADWLGHAHS